MRQRAAQEMKDTARAARRFFDVAPGEVKDALDAKGGYAVVNGFTGSSIWHAIYGFPPFLPGQIEAGFEDFAARWKPILDVFEQENVKFALEVHPTEIAFDLASTRRALAAVDDHPAFVGRDAGRFEASASSGPTSGGQGGGLTTTVGSGGANAASTGAGGSSGITTSAGSGGGGTTCMDTMDEPNDSEATATEVRRVLDDAGKVAHPNPHPNPHASPHPHPKLQP